MATASILTQTSVAPKRTSNRVEKSSELGNINTRIGNAMSQDSRMTLTRMAVSVTCYASIQKTPQNDDGCGRTPLYIFFLN